MIDYVPNHGRTLSATLPFVGANRFAWLSLTYLREWLRMLHAFFLSGEDSLGTLTTLRSRARSQ